MMIRLKEFSRTIMTKMKRSRPKSASVASLKANTSMTSTWRSSTTKMSKTSCVTKMILAMSARANPSRLTS
jgi:hypothetical protein